MTADSDPITGTVVDSGVKYVFNVEWVDGCDGGGLDEQAVRTPTGKSDDSEDCYAVFAKAFACNNGGVGGSVQVGCLAYTFTGGERTEEATDGDDDNTDDGDDDVVDDGGWVPETNEPTNLTCHSLDDFSRKQDVKAGRVTSFAEQVCSDARFLETYSNPSIYTFWNEDDISDIWTDKHANYLYTYEWIKDCKAGTQLTIKPAGQDSDATCESVFEQTFNECTGNQGIGGSIDVGCLRFTLHAGLGDDVIGPLWQRGGKTNGVAIGK